MGRNAMTSPRWSSGAWDVLVFSCSTKFAGSLVEDYGGRIVSNRRLERHCDGAVGRLLGYARLPVQL